MGTSDVVTEKDHLPGVSFGFIKRHTSQTIPLNYPRKNKRLRLVPILG